jgi:hypothetical protein
MVTTAKQAASQAAAAAVQNMLRTAAIIAHKLKCNSDQLCLQHWPTSKGWANCDRCEADYDMHVVPGHCMPDVHDVKVHG